MGTDLTGAWGGAPSRKLRRTNKGRRGLCSSTLRSGSMGAACLCVVPYERRRDGGRRFALRAMLNAQLNYCLDEIW